MSLFKGTNFYKDLLLIYKRLKFQRNNRIINTMYIHKDSFLGEGCRVENGVHIGKGSSMLDWSYLRDDSYLWPHSSVGKYCSIGERVSIGVPIHPISFVSTSSVLYHHKKMERFSI